jgi:ParB-like chromosome segregation protein Spo0J
MSDDGLFEIDGKSFDQSGSGPGQPQQPLNWPEIGLQPHRFAGIFRMLAGEERENFAADIAANGLKQKVVVFGDAILDGRNRYLVLVDEGVFNPEDEHWRDRPELFTEFAGTDAEALDFVWSLNEQRRHDNASQRAMSAARYANLRGITQAEAAEKLGVSERQVSSAAKILEQGEPELVAAVDDGRVPAYLGEQLVDLDEDDQREVAAQPKGEASAVARQKLQDPPPLSESGPVVKPMDPNRLIMFAAAVCEVGKTGRDVDAATLDALAREHNMLADRDGTFNLRREAELAFDVARKRMDVGDGDLYGSSLFAVMTAGMSDDLDLLVADYRQAHKVFDQAMREGQEERAGEAKLLLEALRWHANGKDRGSVLVAERPRALVDAAAAPLGAVPMWGQDGVFAIEVDGLPALVRYNFNDWGYGPSFAYRATRFDLKFPRGGWVEVRASLKDHLGQSVEDAAKLTLSELVEKHTEAKKTTADDRVGMFYPEFICAIDPTERHDHMARIKRGMELIAGQWPALPAGEPWPGINSWPASEQECRDKLNGWKSGSKRGFPKPVHLATYIMMVGTRGHLVPVADFPVDEAYVYENNGHWFYVDDPADPSADAVTARLRPAPEAEAQPADADLLAAYHAALTALTEPKGKLHQATAAEAIRAGVAAGINRQQMSEDLGHPIGTILTWTARLGLTDGSRKGAAA